MIFNFLAEKETFLHSGFHILSSENSKKDAHLERKIRFSYHIYEYRKYKNYFFLNRIFITSRHNPFVRICQYHCGRCFYHFLKYE